MKKITLLSAAVIAYCILQTTCSFSQGTAINTNGSTADSSAILDVSSPSQGILIPRLTEAQKNIIPNPATSLMIFQTDGAVPGYYYNAGTPGAKNWVYLGNDNLGNHTATDSLNMSNQKIVNLATCTYNYDAANKLYVDNMVGAGGGGTSMPVMMSAESPAAYNFRNATYYCDTLTEGGYSDWYMPTFEQFWYALNTHTVAITNPFSSNWIWLRLQCPNNASYIYYARLSDGYLGAYYGDNTRYARCVR